MKKQKNQLENNKPRKTKKAKKSKIYMGPDVDAAIVEYNACDDPIIRNQIYNERIKYAFEKLAENILNNWKFPYVTDSFKNKKAELISHFILNLDKYSPEKGSAFTYFTFAGRNYFIIHNDGNYNKLKSEVRIDLEENDEYSHILELKDTDSDNKDLIDDKQQLIELIKTYFESNIPKIFKKQNDMIIAYAILQLIENYESIENFNKKNIYILIREMTNSKAQNITKVLNKMRNIYKTIISEYLNTGEVTMDYNVIKNSKLFFS